MKSFPAEYLCINWCATSSVRHWLFVERLRSIRNGSVVAAARAVGWSASVGTRWSLLWLVYLLILGSAVSLLLLLFCFVFFICFCFEIESCYSSWLAWKSRCSHAGLSLSAFLLSWPPGCWNYQHALPQFCFMSPFRCQDCTDLIRLNDVLIILLFLFGCVCVVYPCVWYICVCASVYVLSCVQM